MAIPPVVIEFIARGVPDIARATRSVADAVARGDRVVSDTVSTGERTRQRLVEASARDQIQSWQRADAAISAAKRAGVREAEAAARAEVRAAQSSATERIRIAQRVAAEEKRLQMEIARGAGVPGSTSGAQRRLDVIQGAKHGSTDDQKKALDHVGALRVADTAAAAQQRTAARNRQQSLNEQEHDDNRKTALINKAAKDATSALRRQAAEEDRVQEQITAQHKKYAMAVVGGGARAAKMLVGGGVALARTGLNLGGGFDIQDALQSRMHLRGELADISNRGIVTAEQAGGSTENVKRRSVDELQGAVTGVSKQWAIDPEKASAGLDKFASKTGNLTRGMELLSGLAEMSRAGAGDLDNLADAAGDVFNADTTQNADQVLAVMRALSAQGKIGAVEMKDLATQMSALGAAAGRFQGDAGKNMAMMGGLAQLSRASGGSKSASQATTAVSSLTNQLYKNKRIEGFQNLGVSVKDEKTGLNRDLDAILMETLQGAEKKSRASGHGMRDFDVNFGGAVADAQARRATIPLEKAYKEAGGGEAGTKAARALLDKFAGANSSKEDVSAAAAERMKEADVQFERVVLELRDVAARELLPALRDAAPAFAKMVPIVGDVLHELVAIVNWAERNPLAAAFAGLGAMITKSVVTEIASAKLGELLKKILSGSGGGGLPGGGGGPGMGGVGKGLAVVGAAVTAMALTKEWVDEGFGAEDEKDKARRERQTEANDLSARAKRGGLSPEQMSRAKELQQQLATDSKEMGDELDPDNASTIKKVTGAFGSVVGGDDFTESQQAEQREQMRAQKESVEAMRKLTDALADLAKKPPVQGGGGSSNGGGGHVNANDPRYSKSIVKGTTGN